MLGEPESAQVRIHRYVQTCELIFDQSIDFYCQQIEKRFVREIDFERYHVMITGLPRQVYRPFFGIDSFLYSKRFEEIEIEIVQALEKQGVRCMTTMLLYDHTKRFCMIFNKPESFSAVDVAQIAAECFDRLYAQIFDMSQTPYRNYTVVSSEIMGYEHLPKTFKAMDRLSRQQFFDIDTVILTPEMLEASVIPADREQIHEDLTRLHIAMREKDQAEMRISFRAIMRQLKGARSFELLADAMHALHGAIEGMLRSYGFELTDAGMERGQFSAAKYPAIEHMADQMEEALTECMKCLGRAPAMSEPVQEAMRYMRHHCAEDFSVADIAAHIGMSDSWLSKRFRQECGCSIVNHLLGMRIERAKALLEQTAMLIQEIACAVGFETAGYFISVFRKMVGVTPKAYREQMKKQMEENRPLLKPGSAETQTVTTQTLV